MTVDMYVELPQATIDALYALDPDGELDQIIESLIPGPDYDQECQEFLDANTPGVAVYGPE